MKLNSEQVDAIERQTGAMPIPADDPANTALQNAFGEHTFYADQNGLLVLEEITLEETDGDHVAVIQIAQWANDEKTELQPIEPRHTGAVLGLQAPDDADADSEPTA